MGWPVRRIDPSSLFSTPFGAPAVPPFPLGFRDVLILTGIYQTDPEAIRDLLPEPLEPVDDEVLVHIYQMNDTDHFGVYNESAVQVRAVLPATGERGAYSPYLFLDHDGGIASGREVYGQPKKFGRPSIEVRQDLIVGRVSRNGIDVVTMTMAYKTRRCSPEDLIARLDCVGNFNLKVIPGADGSDAIRQLTARDLLDVKVNESWAGPVTVELRPNAQAPVYLLPLREVVGGFLWRCDFTLDHGRVLHDYLARPDGRLAASAGASAGGAPRTAAVPGEPAPGPAGRDEGLGAERTGRGRGL